MIQVIDIVQGRDEDTGDASVHLDRVYDHMYPDISTFMGIGSQIGSVHVKIATI
ncbi:MAG: hypothetical protein BWY45_03197 [Euryarchaeota archaeon ADurb.Bin294]|nr:MAG: hypothetical protein BWY45_03197 [Euryarchaeota archaeon ADurb.Bin294]